MMYSQFSFWSLALVKRVASSSVFGLSVLLAGCSWQGFSFDEIQTSHNQQHNSASEPIPTEPVYGYPDRRTVKTAASDQESAFERQKLTPVRVASLDNNFVGSSYAMQPVSSPDTRSGTATSGGKRYAQSGPAYFAQPNYPRRKRYRNDSHERDIPERYNAERYTRTKPDYPVHHTDGYYKVVSGDTVYGIARRFGMTTTELAKLNGIVGSRIYAGQRLRVSGKASYTSSHRYNHSGDDSEDGSNGAYERGDGDQQEEDNSYSYEDWKSPPPRQNYLITKVITESPRLMLPDLFV